MAERRHSENIEQTNDSDPWRCYAWPNFPDIMVTVLEAATEGETAMSDDEPRPGSMDWFHQAKAPDGTPVPQSVITEWSRYVQAGGRARARHGVLESLSLVVTAAVPACAAFEVGSKWIALIGSAAIVLNGGRQLFGWKESWANRKKVRYAIEREVALFFVGAGRYGEGEAAILLVETVEEICAEEREDWHSRRLANDGYNYQKSNHQQFRNYWQRANARLTTNAHPVL